MTSVLGWEQRRRRGEEWVKGGGGVGGDAGYEKEKWLSR